MANFDDDSLGIFSSDGPNEPPEEPPENNDIVPADDAGDEEPPSDEPQTQRDVQRGALQELVDLSSECAAMEAEIEKKFAAELGDTSTANAQKLAEAEHKYKNFLDQVAGRYEERRAEIEARHKQAVGAQKTAEHNLKNRLRVEFDKAQQQLKKDLEQAVWLAESVLEAAEGKAAEELKKATELNAANIEFLDSKDVEARNTLTRYNQSAPPGENLAVLKEAESKADPAQSIEIHKQTIEQQLRVLANLSVPKVFAGATAYVIGTIFVLVGAGVGQAITGSLEPNFNNIGIGAAGGLVVGILLLLLLKSIAKKQVHAAYRPLRHALDSGRLANENLLTQATMQQEADLLKARKSHKAEANAAKERAAPTLERATKKRDAALAAAQAESIAKIAEADALRKKSLAEIEAWRTRKLGDSKTLFEAEFTKLGGRGSEKEAQVRQRHAEERSALERRWTEGLERIQAPIADEGNAYPAWSDPSWDKWVYPKKFPQKLRFGELEVDLKTIIADVAEEGAFTLPIPGKFNVPALMVYPKQASLLFHTDRAGRADAIRGMQMFMTRLMTTIPPGRVRFTLLDPVGLGQNFAGFMHLADYDEALVGGRIWTDADQIDERLNNLTEHMETVIQKYLRNEFATIDEYNEQAGELAEPYRYLVISDFPTNFSDDSLRRLSSIASTGSRCGVYTLVMRDMRVSTSGGEMHLQDLEAHSVNLVREGDRFVWRDPVFNRFPLKLDDPPTDEELSKILHMVGKGAREAKRVEVAFDLIAPKPQQFWTLKSDTDVQVAVGRSGATRVQMFKMGRGVAQHALVAGKTGSGKSTLMHALISNLAMWYSPDEIELYLIDFKKGVEFKTYAMHQLPHARAIAVESDREFGLSVLQRIDQEMARRAELFRPFKAQNLGMFREASGQKMPRTLLIIDEFQEFFSEDDKLAQDANLLLDRIVRQGRAFGIHLLLGSQTIGGSSGLARSTIGQIGIRIALQTSEADSQMILGDGNSAARLLTRPGEAIYNDAGGLVEGNSPFQVAWLPDEQRDKFLDQVLAKAKASIGGTIPPIVFEGNEPADFRNNEILRDALSAPKYVQTNAAPVIWLGDPVAIKAPTSVAFRRQSGANVLVVGQYEEGAMAILALATIGLAAQLSPAKAKFYLLDGTPTDAQIFGYLPSVIATLPHETKNVDYRSVPEAIHELALELARRQEGDPTGSPSIFVIIFGLQRYRALRKSEDSFSFSSGDEEKPPDPGKEFADLMREGPVNGIHIIAWIDTATALDRTIDRGAMREMDSRILFQMSATDSSNLIDSPMGNKLGSNRALVFSEEQGSMEKFRPYAVPNAKWLEEVKEKLAKKAAGT